MGLFCFDADRYVFLLISVYYLAFRCRLRLIKRRQYGLLRPRNRRASRVYQMDQIGDLTRLLLYRIGLLQLFPPLLFCQTALGPMRILYRTICLDSWCSIDTHFRTGICGPKGVNRVARTRSHCLDSVSELWASGGKQSP